MEELHGGMWQIFILLLTLLCDFTVAYNYLVVSPLFGHSHSTFMGTIADTLTEAGHNVTVLMPILDPDMEEHVGLKLTTNVIKIAPDSRTAAMFLQKEKFTARLWNLSPSAYGMIKVALHTAQSFTYQCDKVLNDDGAMTALKTMQFDVGLAEPFDICGFVLNVSSTIAATSQVQADHISRLIGVPGAPSYVPGSISTKGDNMSITDRLRNVVETYLGNKFHETLYDMEIKLFREKFGQDFKGYEEILSQVSYFFSNSNPYLDYPHPTTHKVVEIGGIAVPPYAKKKLLQEFDEILNARESNVVISFGSILKARYMPEEYKNSLLRVFESMPNTTFIWKYELTESKLAAHLPNVHLFAWIPQNALLSDPRVSVFVSHGGLGSTTEIAYRGKPAVMVPLFGDQTRNANMLAKHGSAIVLQKYDLANYMKVIETVQNVINNPSYARKAKLLADILVNQPISPKELLLKHAEFAARFGKLPNLDPYGRHLSTIQYYLIDLFAVLIIVFLAVTYATYQFLKMLCQLLYGKMKRD